MTRLAMFLTVAVSASLLLPAGLTLAEGTAERRISQALDGPTELEFFEAPLCDVLDFMKDFHEIEIQIDERALQDVGIDKDEPVTCNLKGIALRSALNLFLRQMDLAYIVQDEVLLITTPEELEAPDRMMTKIYPVGDLLSTDEGEGHFPSNGETLIEVITSIVQPDTWENVGGPGAIVGTSFRGVDMLLVSQTYDVHEQIDSLLTQIRAIIQAEETPPATGAATESDG